jgi:hypothetical protein
MTESRSRWFRGGLIAAGLAVAMLIGLGAGRTRSLATLSDDAAVLLPATQIISFQTGIGRLDTRTGAVYELRGNVDNPSTKLHWKRRVAPITGETSGWLEIQRATFNEPGATFLVDVVTGRTWILNDRGNNSGSWDPVDVFR